MAVSIMLVGMFVSSCSNRRFRLRNISDALAVCRFQLEEISLLKKVSQGVRGMKLDSKDQVEEVYLTKAVDDKSIEHNGHGLVLNTVKLQKRDAKGTRIK